MPRPPASLRNSPHRQNSPAPEPVETTTPVKAKAVRMPAAPPPTAQPEQPSLFDAEQTAPVAHDTAAPRQAVSNRAVQPQLFNINSKGDIIQQPVVEIPALNSQSTLDAAFWWFRNHLEQLNRPKNTIASYM